MPSALRRGERVRALRNLDEVCVRTGDIGVVFEEASGEKESPLICWVWTGYASSISAGDVIRV